MRGHTPTVRIRNERGFNHPLIYQKMVERPRQRIAPGAVVEIEDKEGRWIGRGLYNPAAPAGLRILTSDADEPIDAAFFARRIGRAVQLRREVLQLDAVTDAYRVVHAEGDGLSGLIVDRFADVLVIEFYAAGMYLFREAIRAALLRAFPEARTCWFADEHAERQELFNCAPSRPIAPLTINEHGLRFRVQPGGKHKTGFFCDQRDNRHQLARYCAGQRVLDLCCNSGGFAVYAAALGKAAEVTAVDIDEEAIALARRNAQLNDCRITFAQADLFPWLRSAIEAGDRYDVVILDPAKLTRDRDEVINALKKYLDMNKLALQILNPGGLLVTCSCTGLVDEPSFLDMLRRAAFYAEREVQILHVAGAGADHPWLANVPESRYLKVVTARAG